MEARTAIATVAVAAVVGWLFWRRRARRALPAGAGNTGCQVQPAVFNWYAEPVTPVQKTMLIDGSPAAVTIALPNILKGMQSPSRHVILDANNTIRLGTAGEGRLLVKLPARLADVEMIRESFVRSDELEQAISRAQANAAEADHFGDPADAVYGTLGATRQDLAAEPVVDVWMTKARLVARTPLDPEELFRWMCAELTGVRS